MDKRACEPQCWIHSLTESAAIFSSLLLDNHLILRIKKFKQNIIITKRIYENTIPIKKRPNLCNTYGILFVFVFRFTQSTLLGEESIFFFFFHLDKAKTNYSASHVSTFSLCLIKIAYAVALSMLLMTPWWILDWYSDLQELPNINES